MLHTAFYQFAPVADPAAMVLALRELCTPLFGAIIVAREGINGALAGDAADIARVQAALTDPAQLPGAFVGMQFKQSACTTPPFGRLAIRVRPELVTLRAPSVTAHGPSEAGALPPSAFRALLQDPRCIVLDNRNHYEYRLGHFARAINPHVDSFREFVAYVEAHAPTWRDANQPVAMYCTGGIRCEKTSAWMASLGLTVYQLQGGVLNYFRELPDAQNEWQGECFVFDNRVALDTALNETATTPADVYLGPDATPGEQWRLERALRLDSRV